MGDVEDDEERITAALRWRLVLGRHSERALKLGELADRAGPSGQQAAAVDQTLTYLYDREFAKRGHRRAGAGQGDGLSVPAWLAGVRVLFPREAVQVIERDALARYGMTELVTDPEVLGSLEPSVDLVKAILQFKHLMTPPVLAQARRVVAEVVEALSAKLRAEVRPALYGPTDPERTRPVRTFRNADWRRTIRRNLKNWDRERQRLVADRIEFRHRQRSRLAWRVVVAVDQSGSMLDSLIHSAVMAAILASLPAVTVHLVLWDHRIVDVSADAHDPLAVLMGAQLGGGTQLFPALRYCADLITEPERTVVAVVSDWYVYDDVDATVALAQELSAAGVKGLGLCALDADGHADYDERFARALAGAGWWVGAVTPRRLAEHVSQFLGR
ncbi:MAG: VWA domain-containing protein [Myxococcales bacterium]|nr:VWA domain-containing protein [Myxococcales bacterium]